MNVILLKSKTGSEKSVMEKKKHFNTILMDDPSI